RIFWHPYAQKVPGESRADPRLLLHDRLQQDFLSPVADLDLAEVWLDAETDWPAEIPRPPQALETVVIEEEEGMVRFGTEAELAALLHRPQVLREEVLAWEEACWEVRAPGWAGLSASELSSAR
ncbi:MAG: hypothetical protein ACI8S6_005427, partial [Myxococcota bacterium]